jgi:hypothetical protein
MNLCINIITHSTVVSSYWYLGIRQSEHFKSYKLIYFFTRFNTQKSAFYYAEYSCIPYELLKSFLLKAHCSLWGTEYLCVMYMQFVLQIVTSNWTWHLNSTYNFNLFSYFFVILILPLFKLFFFTLFSVLSCYLLPFFLSSRLLLLIHFTSVSLVLSQPPSIFFCPKLLKMHR